MKKSIVSMMAVLVALVLGSQEVRSAPVLDQSQTVENDTAIRVDDGRSLAQTFTAGLSGDLAKVSLFLGGSSADQQAQATISIWGTSSGLPNALLWSQSFTNLTPGSWPEEGQWLDVDTSVSAPTLVAGQVYAIVLETTDATVGGSDNKWLINSTDNLYSGGSFLENRGSGWVSLTISDTAYPAADAAFQTFIVPEPTTVGLACVGLMAILFRSRARYRSYS